MIEYIPITSIFCNYTKECLLNWLEDEVKNLRVRYPITCPEDLIYWPDDYYEKMEQWWSTDNRIQEPIVVIKCGDIYQISDGWHRFAISHKIGLTEVPVYIEMVA